jgi:hypothetical protein
MIIHTMGDLLSHLLTPMWLGTFSLLQVSVRGSMVVSNKADNGGGIFGGPASTLNISSSTVQSNHALSGGGIAATPGSTVWLSADNLVVGNSAEAMGGGVLVDPGTSFPTGPQVLAAVATDNSAPHTANLAVLPRELTLLSNRTIEGYVARTDGGALPVSLKVSGLFGLPSVKFEVSAALDNPQNFRGLEPLAINASDADGIVIMHLRIRKPPGIFPVQFTMFGVKGGSALKTNMSVQVRDCIAGEVSPIPNTCEPCVTGYYSLDPTRPVCEPCPEGASCPGGAVIVPQPGWWHSAADSAQIHRCVNQP